MENYENVSKKVFKSRVFNITAIAITKKRIITYTIYKHIFAHRDAYFFK